MYKLGCYGTITGYDSQTEDSVCKKCLLNVQCRAEAIKIKDAVLQQVAQKNVKDGMSETEALKENRTLTRLFDTKMNIPTTAVSVTKQKKMSDLARSIISLNNPHTVDTFEYHLYEGFKLYREAFKLSDIVEHVQERLASHVSIVSDTEAIRKTVTRVIKELQANGYIVKEATTLCLKSPS
jgi:hypothetical protein